MQAYVDRGAGSYRRIISQDHIAPSCPTLLIRAACVLAAFFRVPLAVHEREFVKASGSLSVPLTGLNIKQYLTYLLVEHSHAINVYSCREFCGFFKRKLDDETSIRYRDIVTVIKERNSGVKPRGIEMQGLVARL